MEPLNRFIITNTGFHNVEAKLAGSTTSVAVLNGVEMVAGNAYTFYLMGLSASSGFDKVALGVLRAD